MTKNSQIKRSKLVIFKNTTNKKYMLYFIHYEKVCGFIKKISTSEYLNNLYMNLCRKVLKKMKLIF